MQIGNQVLLIQRHGFILNRVPECFCTTSRIWQPDFDAPSEQNNRPQRYASQQWMSSRNQSGALEHVFHASTYYQDIYIYIKRIQRAKQVILSQWQLIRIGNLTVVK
jgi:hypothetical protein